MASSQKPYHRLPGTGYNYVIPPWAMFLLFFVMGIFVLLFRGRRNQLWEGDEHLLLVEWDGSREFYKRFHYRDIQAFIVQRTSEGTAVNIILVCLVGLFACLTALVSETAGRIALLVVAGIFGLALLGSLLAGPTCRCWIRTAVQTQPLPSLSRFKRFRKVLNRIRPRIVAAQGELTQEEIPARVQAWEAAAAAAAAAPAATVRYEVDDPNLPPRILS